MHNNQKVPSDDYTGLIFIIKTDGSVWQLIEDPVDGQYSLEEVQGIANCVKVSSGYEHVMALTADGYVYTWGKNTYGQLGSADDRERETPEKVQGLAGIIDISSGNNHCMALSMKGYVYTWGDNYVGQIGNGSFAETKEERKHSSVYQVEGLSDIIQISAGWDMSVALRKDGKVFQWGTKAMPLNFFCTPSPTEVEGLEGIEQISSYGLRSMALSSTGDIWIWGARFFGLDGGFDPPYKAGVFPNAVKIVAGKENIVITDDLEIWHGIIGKINEEDREMYYDAKFERMLSKEDINGYGLKLGTEG